MSCANRSSPSNVNARARRGRVASTALACWMLLLNAAQAAPTVACKPLLMSTPDVRTIRESPILPYEWTVTVLADARHCATRSGMFEIDFIRIKEYSPDLQFTERFQWRDGQFEVSIELAGDEAVLDHRIGFIPPCVCREIPYK
jgi:hypothetical protein